MLDDIGGMLEPQRRPAMPRLQTIVVMPAAEPTGSGDVSGDDGANSDAGTNSRLPRVANTQTIAALIELQRQRRFCIKSQSRSDRSCEAFIARYLGYRTDLPEEERKTLFKRATTIRKQVEKGGHRQRDTQRNSAPSADAGGQMALSVCEPIILNSAASRLAWDNHRKQVEKQMRKLARDLPVAKWVETITGLGDLGLAIIVGETGDLDGYATKERVWKRLGLAVIEGERQQRRHGKEQAAAQGYNPQRRAEIWTLADSMFRHQWRGEKDGIPAHAVGPYGAAYAKRKAHTKAREWSRGHRDNDARRIMMKALLEDLWRAWRGLGSVRATEVWSIE